MNQYWDKELKKPRQRTKYLGVAERKNGAYSKPGRRIAATRAEQEILNCGDSYAINETCKSIGLDKIIDDKIASSWRRCAFKSPKEARCTTVKTGLKAILQNKLFKGAKTSSQAISRLMKTLGRTDLQTSFFKEKVRLLIPSLVYFWGSITDQLHEALSTEQQERLNEKMKTAGFFILLSRQEITKTQILPSYYARQAIEQIFGFAKSNNNILPLRVHDEQSIREAIYLMLVF